MSLMLVVLILSTSPWENSVLSTSTSISSKKENKRNAHRLAPDPNVPSSHWPARSPPVRDEATGWQDGLGTSFIQRPDISLEFYWGTWQRDLTAPACRPHCQRRQDTPHTELVPLFLQSSTTPVMETSRNREKRGQERKWSMKLPWNMLLAWYHVVKAGTTQGITMH